MIVGKAEYAKTDVIQCLGTFSGRGEAGISRRRQLTVHKRFLIDPVYIKALKKGSDVLIAGRKIIGSAVLSVARRLLIDSAVNQIVARRREVDDLDDLVTAEGRQLVRQALESWLDRWHDMDLKARFNEVPDEAATRRTVSARLRSTPMTWRS